MFSAIGADFILAWGSRTRIRDDNKTVNAESAIHSEAQVDESRLQRSFTILKDPGALPQAGIEAAPSALNTYR